MTHAEILFVQSEFALASYAKNLFSGISESSYQTALEDGGKGMSSTQAATFIDNWRILDQYTDAASGLSATIFQKTTGGPKHLAIRGTQPEVGDIIAGGLLAVGVSSKLNPQFIALKAKLEKDWLANGGPLHNQTFTASGHSLGGYLAEAVKEQYGNQVTEAYLFNTPGSGGLVGAIAGLVSDLFNQPSPGANGIWNIKASEGASIIAGLGSQSSAGIPVQIEGAPGAGFDKHSIVRLTDALAVQSLYATLDPNLTLAQLNALVDASGTQIAEGRIIEPPRRYLFGDGAAKVGADEAPALQVGRAKDALLAVADGGTAMEGGWKCHALPKCINETWRIAA